MFTTQDFCHWSANNVTRENTLVPVPRRTPSVSQATRNVVFAPETNDADLQLYILNSTTPDFLPLCNTRITDDGLKCLEGSTIRRLNLANTDIGVDGLRHLINCPALDRLTLDGTKATDEAMELVAHSKSITELLLNGTAVSDNGIARLARMKQLRWLEIVGTRISTNAMRHLKKLNLHRLKLDRVLGDQMAVELDVAYYYECAFKDEADRTIIPGVRANRLRAQV